MTESNTSELACVYSSLILHDDDIDITAEKISKLMTAANVAFEPFWPGLFAKALEGRNIGDLISNIGSGPSAGAAPAADNVASEDAPKKEAAKKEESEDESDDDMGFGLFD